MRWDKLESKALWFKLQTAKQDLHMSFTSFSTYFDHNFAEQEELMALFKNPTMAAWP